MLCDRMRDVVRARKHDGAYPTAKARRPRRSVRDRLDYQLLKGRSHPEHDRPKNVTRDFGIKRPNDLSEALLLVRLLRCPLLHDRLLAGFIVTSVPYPHNARRLDWFQRPVSALAVLWNLSTTWWTGGPLMMQERDRSRARASAIRSHPPSPL